MLTPEQLVVAAILTCIGGAVLSFITSPSKTLAGLVGLVTTAAAAVMIFWAVAHVLSVGPTQAALPKSGFVPRFFYVDGLSCVFLALAALISIPAALYSIVYMRHYTEYGVTRYYPHFLLFLGAIYGLVSTSDMMWVFFIFWQMMTLPGYALIRYEYRQKANVYAANKFLIMMEIACLAVMIGAGLLAAGGAADKYDFDAVSANLPMLLSTKPVITAIAFALFLIGFGIKMGMWPFGQAWLPDAHPAAPSPVSALLSGVMIKTGVYGVLRYFLWLVPQSGWADFPLANWGAVIAILGTITLFTGTMQALRQEQTKRLLAFHSIGQIGYILLGSGTCMALLPTPLAPLATIALFGALFHVLNHGVFKGLLFLNSGSMLHATDTQDLNKLGGLMKYMPLTAITALVASFSISGVPLFNGFASKWAIYVAAIQGSSAAKYLPVCALIAILTSALTLASFIKFFGASFLSRSSQLVSERASHGRLEVGLTMQLPQLFLAAVCILLGILPALGFAFLQSAMRMSQQSYGITLAANGQAITGGLGSGIANLHVGAVFVPLALVAVMAAAFGVARLIAGLGGAQRRSAEPWLCGYVREANCHRYVAHNFYSEIKRYFGWLGGMPRVASKKALPALDVKESP